MSTPRDTSKDHVAEFFEDVASQMVRGYGGVSLLTDHHGTWDPVVPPDLHANPLPPVAEDGTAECWQCKSRFPFGQLDIANNAYTCRPCLLRTAQETAALAPPIEDIKLGRSWGRTIAIIGTCALLIGVGVLIVLMRQP